jgi:hypothetical protein
VIVKRVRSALILFALTLGVACSAKYDLDLTITEDDRVRGTLVMAASRTTAAEAGTIDYEEVATDLPVASVELYEDADFVGRTFVLEEMTIPEFNDAFKTDSGPPLRITREGDAFRFVGTFDLSGEDPAPITDVPSEVSVAITFPGDVSTTNGVADGNHVEWKLPLGVNSTIRAEASAVSNESALDWLLPVAPTVLVAVALVVIAWRRRRASLMPPAGGNESG